MSLIKNISQFIDNTLIDLGRQFRWSYLPPLMIYVAAGVSGLTGIVGVFFIKDYLNLSAAFLAGLGFRAVERRYDESKYVRWVNAFEPINKNKAGIAQSWKLKVTKFYQE